MKARFYDLFVTDRNALKELCQKYSVSYSEKDEVFEFEMDNDVRLFCTIDSVIVEMRTGGILNPTKDYVVIGVNRFFYMRVI